MSEIPVSGFGSHLNKPDLNNLFLFHGPERYFQDQLIDQLEQKVFTDPAAKDFNHHVFYGSDSSLNEILSACLNYPMLSDKKLIVVKQFDELSLNDKDSFMRYLTNPQKSTILVLVADSWGKTKFHTELLKLSSAVNCRKLYEKEIYSWVKSKFKERNIESDEKSLSFLIENLGNNLLRLNSEIEKIINYLPKGNKLTSESVFEITGFSREINVFNLQKELGAKKLQRSLKLSIKLLEQGESINSILPMIFLFFRRMWLVNDLLNRGMNRQKILAELGGSSFYYKDIFNSVNNFSKAKLISIIEHLEQADIQLKTSQKKDASILTMLIYNICKI